MTVIGHQSVWGALLEVSPVVGASGNMAALVT